MVDSLTDATLERTSGPELPRWHAVAVVPAVVLWVAGGVTAVPAMIGGDPTVPVVGDRPAGAGPFEVLDPAPHGLVETGSDRLELPMDAPAWGGSAPIRLEVDHPHDAAVAVDADGAIAWAGRGPLRVLRDGEVSLPEDETPPVRVRRDDARVWGRTQLLHVDDTGLWWVRDTRHGVAYAGHVGSRDAGEARLPYHLEQPLLMVDGRDRRLAVMRSGQHPTAVELDANTVTENAVSLGAPLPPAPVPPPPQGDEDGVVSGQLVVLEYDQEAAGGDVWLSYSGGQPLVAHLPARHTSLARATAGSRVESTTGWLSVAARTPALDASTRATVRLTESRTVVDGRAAAVLDRSEGEDRLIVLLVVDGDGSGAVMLLDPAIQPDWFASVEPVIGADGAVYVVRRTQTALELRAVLDADLDPATDGCGPATVAKRPVLR